MGIYSDTWRLDGRTHVGHFAFVPGEGWREFKSRAAAILWLTYMVGPSDWDCAVESSWQKNVASA